MQLKAQCFGLQRYLCPSERLASVLWRLRRVPFFEAAIIDARHDQASEEKEREGERALAVAEQEDEEPSDWEISVHFGRALINDAWSDALGKRARHETTLMNLFTKTLEMLLSLHQQRP